MMRIHLGKKMGKIEIALFIPNKTGGNGMNIKTITKDDIRGFSQHLEHDEKSQATIDKYHRDVMAFWAVVGGEPLTKEIVMAYKKHLIEQSYAVSSINSMLASVNAFLEYLDLR